jgi:hypothetical protein
MALFGLFGPKPDALPPPEQQAWMLEAWRWLGLHVGEGRKLPAGPIVLPTPESMPVPMAQGHQLALNVSGFVQQRAGLGDWRCALEPQQPDHLRDIALRTGGQVSSRGAAGTFRVEGGRAAISYDPDQLEDLESLVALMAHEWSHHLLALVRAPRPGGPEVEEPLTDLCAVYLGFGVFQANAAFSFGQYTEGLGGGWRSRSLGYLGQKGSSFALAIAAVATDEPIRPIKRHLSPNPRSWFVEGVKELGRSKRAGEG